MRILVTGGAGYLGSVLVRRLLKDKHNVTVVDKGLYGLKSIEALPITVIRRDIKYIEKHDKNFKLLLSIAKDADMKVFLHEYKKDLQRTWIYEHKESARG